MGLMAVAMSAFAFLEDAADLQQLVRSGDSRRSRTASTDDDVGDDDWPWHRRRCGRRGFPAACGCPSSWNARGMTPTNRLG
jgi:hypothetical protein